MLAWWRRFPRHRAKGIRASARASHDTRNEEQGAEGQRKPSSCGKTGACLRQGRACGARLTAHPFEGGVLIAEVGLQIGVSFLGHLLRHPLCKPTGQTASASLHQTDRHTQCGPAASWGIKTTAGHARRKSRTCFVLVSHFDMMNGGHEAAATMVVGAILGMRKSKQLYL